MPADQEGRPQIDREDAVEFGRPDIEQEAARINSGIVDQNIGASPSAVPISSTKLSIEASSVRSAACAKLASLELEFGSNGFE